MNAPQVRHVSVADGTRLHLVDWTPAHPSPGVPILLVHGLASNARLWDGPARALTLRGHQVAALDLRGHGHSDKPHHGYTLASVASDVVNVIEQLTTMHHSWTKPLVIGQSWGGNIVVELAANYPDAVRGIVAVDGGTIELSSAFATWEECERVLRPPAIAGMSYDRLRSYIRAAHPDWSEEAIDGQMYNMERRADDTIAPHLSLENHLAILHDLWQHTPSKYWTQMKVPVLFTPAAKVNDDHVRAKREQMSRALRDIPQVKVEWFEPADHDLHAQFPERFAAVVDHAITTGFFS